METPVKPYQAYEKVGNLDIGGIDYSLQNSLF